MVPNVNTPLDICGTHSLREQIMPDKKRSVPVNNIWLEALCTPRLHALNYQDVEFILVHEHELILVHEHELVL